MEVLGQNHLEVAAKLFDPAETLDNVDPGRARVEKTPDGPNMFKQRAVAAAKKKKTSARKKINVSSDTSVPDPPELRRTRSQSMKSKTLKRNKN